MSHLTYTLDRLRRVLEEASVAPMGTLTVPIDPVPASRPRVSRWSTHYSAKYTEFRAEIAEALKGAVPYVTDKPLAMIVEHVVRRPKTSKLSTPRPDTDNFCKASLDALGSAGLIFEDDRQVALLVGAKRFAEDGETPGIRYDYVEIPEGQEG